MDTAIIVCKDTCSNPRVIITQFKLTIPLSQQYDGRKVHLFDISVQLYKPPFKSQLKVWKPTIFKLVQVCFPRKISKTSSLSWLK